MRQRAGFDIAIVGAGVAGCVMARRFADPSDRSVVLIITIMIAEHLSAKRASIL